MAVLLCILIMLSIASAFISGMEEELNVQGVEYNWMGILFMVGYLS